MNLDIEFVRRLLSAQFPSLATLSLERIQSGGTDNAIYRLGKDRVLRLPCDSQAAKCIEKEYEWMPKLAPFLPMAIPKPLQKGNPGESFPWHWSIYGWIEGHTPTQENLTDQNLAATALAHFISSLQQIDTTGGPLSGEQNGFRGVELSQRDLLTRKAIATLHTVLGSKALTSAWDRALEAPLWSKNPVWLHGDLHEGNLLVKDGKLSAVIDFGLMGVGDPACDLMVGWTFLCADARKVFRAQLSMEDASWARGRGWALSFGLIALAYYLDKNPILSRIARQTIDAVLDDRE